MSVFKHKINRDVVFKSSEISLSTQEHLRKVYSCLAVCMFAAAAGVCVEAYTKIFQAGSLANFFLIILGIHLVGLIGWLPTIPHTPQSKNKRLAILVGIAFLAGVELVPAIKYAIAIDPSIIVTAFLGTSLMFLCFTLSALFAQRRSYLYLGGSLMSGLSILQEMSILSQFFGSEMFFKVYVYVSLAIMCGFVLFDTQLIIEKAEMGDKDYIWHCVDLFLDFVTILWCLIVLLAEKDKRKGKK